MALKRSTGFGLGTLFPKLATVTCFRLLFSSFQAYMLSSPDTIEREFSALRNIKDNYPKYVISMDTIFGNDFEGIQRINLIDFLLNPKI